MSPEQDCGRCHGARAVPAEDGVSWRLCPACVPVDAGMGGGFTISTVDAMVVVNALVLAATDPVWVRPEHLSDEELGQVWRARGMAYAGLLDAPTGPNEWMRQANQMRQRVMEAFIAQAAEVIANGGPS